MSSSNPKSSLLRPTARRSKSGHHTPPPSSQADLQRKLPEEIRDHVWEFGAERIAGMLSADGKALSDTFVDSAHRSLGERAQPSWPTSKPESESYPPLEKFLNDCAEVCHSVLDGIGGAASRGERWYDTLKFIVYDKITEDGVDGSSPVKPDLVGGLDLNPGVRAAWSPRDQSMNQVLLPVEVKKDWLPMVVQATTYARCLFSASPSRQFALVLGFRHAKAELRFLVFHRSGLTASKPLSVNDEQGRKDILRVLFSILSWKSTGDAGFLEFYNDTEMSLFYREDDTTGVVARVTEVLHDGLCVLGRASRVLLVAYSSRSGEEQEPEVPTLRTTVRSRGRSKPEIQIDRGGETQPHVTPSTRPLRRTPVTCPSPSIRVWSSDLDSYSANGGPTFVVVKHSWCEERRREVEADLLTACKDDFGTPNHCYSFCPTDPRGNPMSTARFLPADNEQLEHFHWKIIATSHVPSDPRRRRLWVHVSKRAGRSLVHAKRPWELCVAVGHGMLGWLSILKKGFLHRDISIGNTLMLDPPATMKPFEAQASLLGVDESSGYAKLLEDAVRKMDFSEGCHGFVTDGDMAAKLEGYFTPRVTGETSGTYEFMSKRLLRTLWDSKPYLHSPIDDLESFYYTAQWATAFNDGAKGGKYNGSRIQQFRDMIAGQGRNDATDMVLDELLVAEEAEEEYGPFFAHSLPLLRTWFLKLADLGSDWAKVMNRARQLDGDEKDNFLRSGFSTYSHRGVAEYLELVHEHRVLLKEEV